MDKHEFRAFFADRINGSSSTPPVYTWIPLAKRSGLTFKEFLSLCNRNYYLGIYFFKYIGNNWWMYRILKKSSMKNMKRMWEDA